MEAEAKREIQKMARAIRLRVLTHTVEGNGGYLSQACSSAEIFSVLYRSVLRLDELGAPLMPEIFTGTPCAGRKAVTGVRFNGNGRRDCDNFILSPAQ